MSSSTNTPPRPSTIYHSRPFTIRNPCAPQSSAANAAVTGQDRQARNTAPRRCAISSREPSPNPSHCLSRSNSQLTVTSLVSVGDGPSIIADNKGSVSRPTGEPNSDSAILRSTHGVSDTRSRDDLAITIPRDIHRSQASSCASPEIRSGRSTPHRPSSNIAESAASTSHASVTGLGRSPSLSSPPSRRRRTSGSLTPRAPDSPSLDLTDLPSTSRRRSSICSNGDLEIITELATCESTAPELTAPELSSTKSSDSSDPSYSPPLETPPESLPNPFDQSNHFRIATGPPASVGPRIKSVPKIVPDDEGDPVGFIFKSKRRRATSTSTQGSVRSRGSVDLRPPQLTLTSAQTVPSSPPTRLITPLPVSPVASPSLTILVTDPNDSAQIEPNSPAIPTHRTSCKPRSILKKAPSPDMSPNSSMVFLPQSPLREASPDRGRKAQHLLLAMSQHVAALIAQCTEAGLSGVHDVLAGWFRPAQVVPYRPAVAAGSLSPGHAGRGLAVVVMGATEGESRSRWPRCTGAD